MVQLYRFSVVLVDGLPMFQVKLEKAAFFSSGWACWFNASTQFFFMTALLMRWQVIPANFVVFFVIDLIFEIPRDHMLPRVKNNNNNNNNNNVNANVYSAVVIAIVRVHPVHLMNKASAQGGRRPPNQANRLGLWVRLSVAIPSTYTIVIYYYYSARNLMFVILILCLKYWRHVMVIKTRFNLQLGRR